MVLELEPGETSSLHTSHTADTNPQHHVAGCTSRIILAQVCGAVVGKVANKTLKPSKTGAARIVARTVRSKQAMDVLKWPM